MYKKRRTRKKKNRIREETEVKGERRGRRKYGDENDTDEFQSLGAKISGRESFPSGVDLGMRSVSTIKHVEGSFEAVDRSSPRQSPAGWSDRSPRAITRVTSSSVRIKSFSRMVVWPWRCFVPSISPRKVDLLGQDRILRRE